jgi:hypothetical protein
MLFTKFDNLSRIIQHGNHMKISNDSLYNKKYVCKQIILDWNNLLFFLYVIFLFWELGAVASNIFPRTFLHDWVADVSRLERYCTNVLLARLTNVRCQMCERARPRSQL